MTFERSGRGTAQLRTLWEMAPDEAGGFRPEPIPAYVVHVPTQAQITDARARIAAAGMTTSPIGENLLKYYPTDPTGSINVKALVYVDAFIPDEGQIFLDGRQVHFRTPMDARSAGIETVYQTLAVAPGLDIADNLFLGREVRKPGALGSVFRMLDRSRMRAPREKNVLQLAGLGGKRLVEAWMRMTVNVHPP